VHTFRATACRNSCIVVSPPCILPRRVHTLCSVFHNTLYTSLVVPMCHPARRWELPPVTLLLLATTTNDLSTAFDTVHKGVPYETDIRWCTVYQPLAHVVNAHSLHDPCQVALHAAVVVLQIQVRGRTHSRGQWQTDGLTAHGWAACTVLGCWMRECVWGATWHCVVL